MIDLSNISTRAPKGLDKDEIKARTRELAEEVHDLQETMYAEGKHSLLAVFQGMDSSGKDGTSRKVFRECGPAHVSGVSFGKPTDEERAHDFLWRVHRHAPAKGKITVFNRSHYEDILIQRVHGWITEEQVKERMASINAWEHLLQYDNGTTVAKFYLHISHGRQQEKLQARIDEPEDNWKHNPNDWNESERWDDYRKAYEYAINESRIPWIIVPADQKWYRDYFATLKVVEILRSLNMKRPTLSR